MAKLQYPYKIRTLALKDDEEEVIKEAMTITGAGLKSTILTALRLFVQQNKDLKLYVEEPKKH